MSGAKIEALLFAVFAGYRIFAQEKIIGHYCQLILCWRILFKYLALEIFIQEISTLLVCLE
jgi:hypothetical protein